MFYFIKENISYATAMQPYWDLGYDYFNLVVVFWIKEMLFCNNYVNTFYRVYVRTQKTISLSTDILLIIECCLQWEIKEFIKN